MNDTAKTLSFTGTVIDVQNNIVIQKVNGTGTYTGTRLTYRDFKGGARDKTFTSKTLEMNPNVEAVLLGLKPNEDFTAYYVKNGDFSNVTEIVKGKQPYNPQATASTGKGLEPATTGMSSNTEGQIKGNIVSNAVALAIARSPSKGIVSSATLEIAADDVLLLHAYVESKSVAKTIAEEVAKIKTAEAAGPTATEQAEQF